MIWPNLTMSPASAIGLRAILWPEATGADTRGANLAEASLCAALERAARESSRQGGCEVALPGVLT